MNYLPYILLFNINKDVRLQKKRCSRVAWEVQVV